LLETGHRQIAQPGLVVGVGVERLLEELDRRRAEGGDLVGPPPRLGHQLARRDDLVDQAHRQRLLGVIEPAPEPDLAGLLLADDPGKVGRAEAGVERADARAGLAEPRRLAGDRHVADDLKDVASADSQPVDGGDDRLGDVAQRAVEVADLEAPGLGRAVVAGLGALLDVASGAERLVAGAGEDDAAHGGVHPCRPQGGEQLVDRLGAEGVVALGPVDGDDHGWTVDFVRDVLVVGHSRHPLRP